MAAINRALWPAVNRLLDEALALAPNDLAAWLDQLTKREPILGDEVRRFLAADPAPNEGFAALQIDPPSLVGQTVGGYTLERPIGAGGMGSVWLARRTDHPIGIPVAIKFLNLALLGRAGQERFGREASLLARLDHPNIAKQIGRAHV